MKTIFKPGLVLYACVFLWLFSGCARSSTDKRFSFDLIPVKTDKWGYINNEGKMVINPSFESASLFCEGLAVVRENGKTGYIDPSGKFVIAPTFANGTNFSEGLAFVTPVKGDPVCIDKTGKVMFKLDKVDAVYPFTEGLACIQKGGDFGCIDKKGEEVIFPNHKAKLIFCDGLAADVIVTDKGDALYGYIDKDGKVAIKHQFSFASNFKDGLAPVQSGDQWGFINKTGSFVINPQFYLVDHFSEGYAAVSTGDKFGYIDKTGKMAIEPQFDAIGSFTNGLSSVRLQKKWGYIDKQGKFVINPEFDEVGEFYSEIAGVVSGGKIGFIDKQGKYKVSPQFNNLNILSNDQSAYSDHFDYKSLFSYYKGRDGKFLVYSKGSTFGDIGRYSDGYDINTEFVVTLKPRKSLLSEVVIPTTSIGYRQSIYAHENDTRYLNPNAQVGTVELDYDLSEAGPVTNKGIELAQAMKEELTRQFGCKDAPVLPYTDDPRYMTDVMLKWEMYKKDPKNEYMLFSKDFTFLIIYKEDNVRLVVSIM